MENNKVLIVASTSNPSSVAGALVAYVKENGKTNIQVIGAGALNQAIKAVAIARGFVAPMGNDLVVIPAFADVSINGEGRTALSLDVELIKR